jgi:tRNA 2-thiouridine synthesizing protein A
MPQNLPKQRVDACGQSCPMPLLMAKRALRDLASGELLEVLATDPGSERDFQSLQRLAGHYVVTHRQDDGVLQHLITKA